MTLEIPWNVTNSTSSTTTSTTTSTTYQSTTTMTLDELGCYPSAAPSVLEGAAGVCGGTGLIIFQILVSDDVFSADGFVNAYITDSTAASNHHTATTHKLMTEFQGNLAETRFDGFFYMIGNTVVTANQGSLDSLWTIDVAYFPPSTAPQISGNMLVNQAEAKLGHLTFSANLGQLTSALSLIVDLGISNVKGMYSAVSPSQGGFIVPILYEGSKIRQAALYHWSTNRNWTVTGYNFGSSQALAVLQDVHGVVAEMKIGVGTEAMMDTGCHSDSAYVNLSPDDVCPTTTTNTTTSSTSTSSTSTSTTSTATTSTNTTITTVTTTTSTTTTVRIASPTTITGSFIMNVPNSEYVLDDGGFSMSAKSAVKNGIADAFGIPSSYVLAAAFSLARRLAGAEAALRRLTDAVKVDYSILIPGSYGEAARDLAVQKAIGLTSRELTAAIRVRTSASLGADYMPTVTSMTAPEIRYEEPGYVPQNPVSTTTNWKRSSSCARDRAGKFLSLVLLLGVRHVYFHVL